RRQSGMPTGVAGARRAPVSCGAQPEARNAGARVVVRPSQDRTTGGAEAPRLAIPVGWRLVLGDAASPYARLPENRRSNRVEHAQCFGTPRVGGHAAERSRLNKPAPRKPGT